MINCTAVWASHLLGYIINKKPGHASSFDLRCEVLQFQLFHKSLLKVLRGTFKLFAGTHKFLWMKIHVLGQIFMTLTTVWYLIPWRSNCASLYDIVTELVCTEPVFWIYVLFSCSITLVWISSFFILWWLYAYINVYKRSFFWYFNTILIFLTTKISKNHAQNFLSFFCFLKFLLVLCFLIT